MYQVWEILDYEEKDVSTVLSKELGMIESIREYLQAFSKMDERGRPFYDWFLRKGKAFVKTRSTRGLTYRGKAKECYYNAQKAAIYNHLLTYYEGLAYSEGLIPVDHAWVVYKGRVIDPTWERWKRKTVYFGIPIPTEYISSYWARTGMADDLIKRYFWEIVRKGRLPK